MKTQALDVNRPVSFSMDILREDPEVQGPVQLEKLGHQDCLNTIVPFALLHVTGRTTQYKILVDTRE
jgi:hypothetical protein